MSKFFENFFKHSINDKKNIWSKFQVTLFSYLKPLKIINNNKIPPWRIEWITNVVKI